MFSLTETWISLTIYCGVVVFAVYQCAQNCSSWTFFFKVLKDIFKLKFKDAQGEHSELNFGSLQNCYCKKFNLLTEFPVSKSKSLNTHNEMVLWNFINNLAFQESPGIKIIKFTSKCYSSVFSECVQMIRDSVQLEHIWKNKKTRNKAELTS